MKVGYMRVSTDKDVQKFDRQEDQLIAAGCEKICSERISGKAASKPELEKMISDLTESNDPEKEIIVVSIDRLGRSTVQVINTVNRLDSLGIGLTSLKEGFQANTPQARFFLTIIAAFAQLEADMCSDRVKQGLAAAKKRGKKLGRPHTNQETMNTAIRMWESHDYSINEICSIAGIAKQTLYNEIKRRGITRD